MASLCLPSKRQWPQASTPRVEAAPFESAPAITAASWASTTSGSTMCSPIIRGNRTRHEMLRLSLRHNVSVPVDASVVAPDRMTGLTRSEIEGLRLQVGNRSVELAELFAVDGDT